MAKTTNQYRRLLIQWEKFYLFMSIAGFRLTAIDADGWTARFANWYAIEHD